MYGPEREDEQVYLSGQEIQGNRTLEKKLNEYTKFHDYRILNPHDGEKVNKGLRVVRKVTKNKDFKAGDLGSIDDVTENGEVFIKWDKHDNESESFHTDQFNQYKLLLFDNAQADVKHEDCTCDGCRQDPLYGIRWKCLTCAEYDLCTKCYIIDKHNVDHIFKRIVSPNSKGVEMPPRKVKKGFGQHDTRYGSGILKFSEVEIRDNVSELTTTTGIIQRYNANRSTVFVKLNDPIYTEDQEKKITELKLKDGGKFPYYPDHLPVLVHNYDYVFEVDVNELKTKIKKIEVIIWRNIQKKKNTFTPTLYLIFDNQCKDHKHREAFMTDVIDFAIKTKLPCHIKEQKVLFHSGSNDSVCIHYKTDKATVEQLISRGFHIFERGDILSGETESNYFLQMAEYAIGEDVLPVIISLRNGITEVQGIPIILLKKNTQDVSVVWPMKNGKARKTEHKSIKPWKVTKLIEIRKENIQSDDLETTDTKNNLSKDGTDFVPKIQLNELDTLVCHLIIGGCLTDEDLLEKKDGHDYLTALSIYLLKKKKWKIPKQHIGKTFDQKCLEYIHEQDMTADYFEKLWYTQMSFIKMEYKPPEYQQTDSEDVADSAEISHCCSFRKGNKGQRIDITKWNSECYGLIFFALLQKQYWSGATQLVEKGYIRIHHLLVGCVILEDQANSWKTTVQQKEKLQRLKGAFTERAVCITHCIYDADNKAEDDAKEGKRIGSKVEQNQSWNKDDKELDECINQAERLLLNHGYLTDAIMTKSNTFLENDTVKKILNKKWYGTEKINCYSVFSFICLAAIHPVVLPILMINMETRPFLWLYKKYKLPFLKVLIHMLGFLVLLNAYAYMLLFDYSDDGITNSDWFIIAWISSFVVDELKQVIVAIIRGKKKHYATDKWNILDWFFIMVYTIGMVLRICEGTGFRISSKCLLVMAFMFLCIRMLNLCCMTEFLGPKLVIIKRMINDTIAFMIVMTVIMVWYSVSIYALLYPNSEFSWTQIGNILSNGYWVLFGELNLDDETLTVPYCSFNRTEYGSGILPQCPTQLGVDLAPCLTAFYGLIAVVLLLNLLIAIYSDSYNEVQQKSEFYWRQIQNAFLEEYSIKTVFPIHLQLVALPGIIFAISTVCYYYLSGTLADKEEKLNNRPMIVRVFLYNTNSDLRLKSTDVAEENGAVDAKGKVDLADFDSITRELDCSSTSQRDDILKTHETEILESLRKIDGISKDLEAIKEKLSMKAETSQVTEKRIIRPMHHNIPFADDI